MATHRSEKLEWAAGVTGRRARRGSFTLVELLAVVGIIVVLISILLPSLRKSLRQAAGTVCMHNLKQIGQAIDLYAIDNNGWGPATTGSDDERDQAPPLSTWFQKLVPYHLGDPIALVCPEDPVRPWLLSNYSFNAYDPSSMASSYGMNGFVLASPGRFLSNLGGVRPTRPANTLLIADMGPDVMHVGTSGPNSPKGPRRSNGSLAWDDGDIGDPDRMVPWITERHLWGINVLMVGLNVERVSTRELMSKTIVSFYEPCAAGDCTLCKPQVALPHYSFAASQTFWWTGPLPTP